MVFKMTSHKKKIVSGIVIVLVVAVVTVAVVLVVTRTPNPNVVGTYVGFNGAEEMSLAKDGTLTPAPISFGGQTGPATQRYWVRGNNIWIDDPKGPPALKIKGNNRLVGGNNRVWVKQLVKPNRPASLVGTYTSWKPSAESNPPSSSTVPYLIPYSDGVYSESWLELDENGGAYVEQPQDGGSSEQSGIWVANKNVVTVTFNTEKMTYTIKGKNLVGGGKELAKTSLELPPMP